MEAIVATRARIEAIWRIIIVVEMRATSPSRAIQAVPKRSEHELSVEIVALNRLTGARWRAASLSCNSRRIYNLPVSMSRHRFYSADEVSPSLAQAGGF